MPPLFFSTPEAWIHPAGQRRELTGIFIWMSGANRWWMSELLVVHCHWRTGTIRKGGGGEVTAGILSWNWGGLLLAAVAPNSININCFGTVLSQVYLLIFQCHLTTSAVFSLNLLTERCRRVECACAQTLLGILITMLPSWGVAELLELSGLLFQGATHYIIIPKIRLLEGLHKTK